MVGLPVRDPAVRQRPARRPARAHAQRQLVQIGNAGLGVGRTAQRVVNLVKRGDRGGREAPRHRGVVHRDRRVVVRHQDDLVRRVAQRAVIIGVEVRAAVPDDRGHADIDRLLPQRGLQLAHEGGQAVPQGFALHALEVDRHARVCARFDLCGELAHDLRPGGRVGQDGLRGGLVGHLHGQIGRHPGLREDIDRVLTAVRHPPRIAVFARRVQIGRTVPPLQTAPAERDRVHLRPQRPLAPRRNRVEAVQPVGFAVRPVVQAHHHRRGLLAPGRARRVEGIRRLALDDAAVIGNRDGALVGGHVGKGDGQAAVLPGQGVIAQRVHQHDGHLLPGDRRVRAERARFGHRAVRPGGLDLVIVPRRRGDVRKARRRGYGQLPAHQPVEHGDELRPRQAPAHAELSVPHALHDPGLGRLRDRLGRPAGRGHVGIGRPGHCRQAGRQRRRQRGAYQFLSFHLCHPPYPSIIHPPAGRMSANL